MLSARPKTNEKTKQFKTKSLMDNPLYQGIRYKIFQHIVQSNNKWFKNNVTSAYFTAVIEHSNEALNYCVYNICTSRNSPIHGIYPDDALDRRKLREQ